MVFFVNPEKFYKIAHALFIVMFLPIYYNPGVSVLLSTTGEGVLVVAPNLWLRIRTP